MLPHHLPLTCELWTLVENRNNEHYIYWKIVTSWYHFAFDFHLNVTCVTGGSGVPWLTLADGLSWLWHPTLSVSTALPPAGCRLLPSITELTLVTLVALAAVGLTLRHTQTVSTPGDGGMKEERQVRGDGRYVAEVCWWWLLWDWQDWVICISLRDIPV